MIIYGGTINCSGKCHNINLAMGGYVLNSLMIAIPMDGADVVLGVQWCPMVTITRNNGF